ncbi:sugar transporter [Pararhodobacter zhoushanensis]|uniref:Sugar transporter n=1 Tax=Pararhodobacter zhoushanensis TaxID=2479545 RepID=A0ABT3GVE6_9RHOB|nr:sugar transporter [Pararhodobacter zhoushanensis]MCW1931507.1 sugar transporter [Pararhodobacter zhoushanensis]
MNDDTPARGKRQLNPGTPQQARQAERQAARKARAASALSGDNDTDQSEPTGEIRVRPVAAPARIRRRHRGLFLSFVMMVVLPVTLATAYLYVLAQDQYASTTGFTVRSDESASATEMLGGLSAIVGGGSSSNTHVLYAYIQSQQLVERVQEQVDIRSLYSQNWDSDPLFSLWPDATIEDLLWFWQRMVVISYDMNSGLMDVQVKAHTAEMAQRIARIIVSESEQMINALNEQARSDAMSNAEADLEAALARLRSAREDIASFRARTQIVDPQADIAGRMGVINGLQESLATALVDYDLLLQTTAESDPRVRQAERRIEVIRQRIGEERRNFATQDVTVFDTDYPRLIAQFESLTVNQEFAERTYTAALTALDAARSTAQRQSLYLATYVQPTLAQRAEYPQRSLLVLLTLIFAGLIWSALALIYYSLRDRG